jgi:Subtilase family
MNFTPILAGAVACSVFFPTIANAQDSSDAVPIVVCAVDGVDPAALAASIGADLASGVPGQPIYLLYLSGVSPQQVQQAVALLNADPDTVFAEVDRSGEHPEECPPLPDPGGGLPCTIGIVDTTPTVAEYEGQDFAGVIELDVAQGLMGPAIPLVAVIDTGIFGGHAHLQGADILPGYDLVDGDGDPDDEANQLDDDGDGRVDEGYGHGTHVTGTILRVSPGARILPIRALDSDGRGMGYDIAYGIFLAVDDGADVINLSLGMTGPSQGVAAALQYAEAMGVTVLVSAGNSGDQAEIFPANYDPLMLQWRLPGLEHSDLDGAEILTVAATEVTDLKAWFSSWGANIDFCAPGVGIYSMLPPRPEYPGNDGYAWWSGTSMATAVASGVAALALDAGDGAPAVPLWPAVSDSCVSIDGLNLPYAGGLGLGRLNALDAALAARTP